MLAKILVAICLVILVSLPWFLPRKRHPRGNEVGGSDDGGAGVDGAWVSDQHGGHDAGHGGGDGAGSH